MGLIPNCVKHAKIMKEIENRLKEREMKLLNKQDLDKLVEEPFEKFLSRLDLKCPAPVEAIPIDKPFLKMKYKGYTVYKTEWLKEHIEMEYRVIKGISESKAEAIPVEWIEKWFNQFYGEQGLEWNRCKRFMLEDWKKENGTDR